VGRLVIRTLRVRNLAVIEELELEFTPGLNVVTGETGAGKSVLLGALALLRGGRLASELVRSGAKQAQVEAVFDDRDLLAAAREQGLASEEDEEVLVTRTVSAEGRGRVSVNGSLGTAALLRRLLGDVVEVAGQGEHYRLLRAETQAELLDRYAGLEAEVEETSRLHRRWTELSAEIHERRTLAEERLRLEDRLRYEIGQIAEVDPRPGELEGLAAERGRLAHADRLGRDTADALVVIEGDDGLRDRLGSIESRLEQAARLDPTLEGPLEALRRAGLELSEALGQLQSYAGSLELDPARLDAVESRLRDLQGLQERYGATIEDILEYQRRAERELEEIGGGEARLKALEEERGDVASALDRHATRLSEQRRKSARDLSGAVEAELAELDLGRARFEVRFEPIDADGPPCGPRGRERAEFWLAPNLGEEPRRLREAASGGELARVCLALRQALRDADRGRVLLFDEVDAGIGGRTARRVGERLRSLGDRHQVICITHLPQIAALGETHYRILKRVRGGRTRTLAALLPEEERVEEIARLAGGGRVTTAARTHARELLER
jgi:DNA repair protein RecN (Recombination protein N)